MSAEDRQSDDRLQRLSEQVHAQATAYEAMAEVYEKYSVALARILEMLRQCTDLVRDSDKDVEVYFTEIIADITVIGEHLRHTEDVLRTDIRAFFDRMNELSVALARVEHRMHSTETSLGALHEALAALKAETSNTLNVVQSVHHQQSAFLTFWSKWKYWLFAFLSFVGLIEVLLQLGIIDIVWFKSR